MSTETTVEMDETTTLESSGSVAVRYSPGDGTVRGTSTAQQHVLYLEHPNSGQVLSCLRTLVHYHAVGSKDRVLYAIETILDGPPPTPKRDLAEFRRVMCGVVLKHWGTKKVLSNKQPAESRLVHNMPKLLSAIGDAVVMAGVTAASFGPMVDLYTAILHQVADSRAVAFPSVEAAIGASSVKSIRASVLRATNRLVLAPVARPGSTAEELLRWVAAGIERREVVLAVGNTDREFLVCYIAAALRMLKMDEPRLRDGGRDLMKAVLFHKPAQMSSMINLTYDPGSITAANLTSVLETVKNTVGQSCEKVWSSHLQAEAKALSANQPRRRMRQARLGKNAKQQRQVSKATAERRQTATAKVQKAHEAETQLANRRQHHDVDSKRLFLAEHRVMESGLYRERGLWGPEKPSPLDKWQLDTTEGPLRMRKVLRSNPTFYHDYPWDPLRAAIQESSAPESERAKREPRSRDSEAHYNTYIAPCLEAARRRTSASDPGGEDVPPMLSRDRSATHGGSKSSLGVGAWDCDSSMSTSALAMMPSGLVGPSSPIKTTLTSRPSVDVSFPPDVASADVESGDPEASQEAAAEEEPAVLRLLEPDDQVKMRLRASLVWGLDASQGIFFLCEHNAYFLEGYALSSAEGSSVVQIRAEHRLLDAAEPILKWSFEDIKDIRRGRYLLQDRALEIHSVDGNNSLLAFSGREKRNVAYQNLCGSAPALAESAEESVAGMHRDAKVEQGGLLSALSFSGSRTVTQRWETGDISNFEYLMHLNTLAGRSYNDLNQYPVFPWIIADYTSQELDLSDPRTFRDLSKPMGALTPKRAEGFKLRFDSWDSTLDDGTPPFHYGTHYSSAAIVASYLIRLEPFTKLFLKLQGGHFDHPDRMFDSIPGAWESASEKNNGDVRELIPEFFYQAEFLENSNHFDLGRKQNGTVLDNVRMCCLPCVAVFFAPLPAPAPGATPPSDSLPTA